MTNYEDPNQHSYHPDNSGVPQYGTEEYNRWYRANFGPTSPNPPQRPGPKREWRAAWWVAGGVVVALVALGIVGAALNSGHKTSGKPVAHATAPRYTSHDTPVPPTDDPTTPDSDSSVDQMPSDAPTEDEADPTVENEHIGGTVELTDQDDPSSEFDITVNSVSSHLYPADWDASYMDSSDRPANGRFLTINVTIDAVSGSYDYNEWDFAVQEADGTQYDVTDGNATSGDFEPELSSGTLDTGQKIRGNVTFDVPTTSGAEITLSNAGELLGTWK